MMSRVDTISGEKLPKMVLMTYVEFLVFLATISREVCKKTEYESKPLNEKIQQVVNSIIN